MLAYTAEKLVPMVLVVDDVDVEVVGMVMTIGIEVVDVVMMMMGVVVVDDEVVLLTVTGTLVVVEDVGGAVVVLVVLVVAATLVVVVDALGPTGPSEPQPSRAAIASTPAA